MKLTDIDTETYDALLRMDVSFNVRLNFYDKSSDYYQFNLNWVDIEKEEFHIKKVTWSKGDGLYGDIISYKEGEDTEIDLVDLFGKRFR